MSNGMTSRAISALTRPNSMNDEGDGLGAAVKNADGRMHWSLTICWGGVSWPLRFDE